MVDIYADVLGAHPPEIPLVVDLDGTLLKSDSLWELLSHAVRAVDWRMLPRVLKGKASFKKYLADRYQLAIAIAPWNRRIVDLVDKAKAEGREVWLATGADSVMAARVDDHFNLTGYFASDGENNCTGRNKARQLVDAFGDKGFIYAGNDGDDFPVWAHAAGVVAISRSRGFAARVLKAHPSAMVIDFSFRPKTLLRVLRAHQWAKNALLFLPIFLAHDFSVTSVLKAFVAFLAFCMAGSAGYVFNDLLDLDSDRGHPQKKNRPFASGEAALRTGWHLFGALLLAAVALSFFLPIGFLASIVGYLFLTCLYSVFLKTKALIDAIALSLFYILRIFAGCMAIAVDLSPWMATLSFFLFLSLVCAKRVVELQNSINEKGEINKRRKYVFDDRDVLYQASMSAATCATISFCLYAADVSSVALYRHKHILLMIAPVFYYWQLRIIFLTNRRQMNEDPVLFAIKDKQTYICAAVIVALYALAI